MNRIRVLIADDHAVLQAGLKSLLNAESDILVTGTASDGDECVRMAATTKPDVILLDINMPHTNGIEALHKLRTIAPESRVLVLTMHDDAGYLREVMAMGAAGYVLKQAAGTELLAAIRAVYQGGVYLHPSHALLLMQPGAPEPPDSPAIPADGDRFDLLSKREKQIFRMVALGYRNQEIAGELSLSVKTVETYKSRMMQKLGLVSRIALVRYALERGILGPDAR